MFGLGEFFHGGMRSFNMQYRCLSVAMMPQHRPEVERGGKIVLPPSALDLLTRLNIAYPMLFKLTNPAPERQRVTHCGVLEFVAEEGTCYLPYWMMTNLQLEENSLIQVESISLPVATHAKFKPMNVEFVDISNPRAVLEVHLRNFACLTKGDLIPIDYNAMRYELLVQEVRPGPAVSIIECDMNVEFDAPEGYVEPEYKRPEPEQVEQTPMEDLDLEAAGAGNRFVPFTGEGFRLDGRTKKVSESAKEEPNAPRKVSVPVRGIPNYGYVPGKLTFIRSGRPKENQPPEGEDADSFKPFSGEGQKLRSKK